MCGIAGIWGKANEDLIRRITEIITHRGPDDRGSNAFSDLRRAASRWQRRLSRIDFSSAGHTAMANEDETVWAVVSGEIYNFLSFRDQRVAGGYRFRSRA